MDNTNIHKDEQKDATKTSADKKPAESTTTMETADVAPIVKPQNAEPKNEVLAEEKPDGTCIAEKGDTLLAIANRHKVSLGLLKVLNCIDDALKQLDEGKLIKLK